MIALLIAVAVLVTFALIIVEPTVYAEAFLASLKLWANSVLPSLFPVMLLAKYVVDRRLLNPLTGRAKIVTSLLGIGKNGLNCALLGLLGGYPVGASCIANYYRQGVLDQRSAYKISLLANAPNPVFCVATLGVCFAQNALFGLAVYCCCLFCNTMCVIVLRKMPYFEHNVPFVSQNNSQTPLFTLLTQTIGSTLTVGALIALFGTLAQFLSQVASSALVQYNGFPFSLTYGILEMTRGCYEVCLRYGTKLALPLCCFFVQFGGVCVNMQLLFLYQESRLNIGGALILTRLAQGLFCALLGYVASFLL